MMVVPFPEALVKVPVDVNRKRYQANTRSAG
jgi:hypothetical protein